MKALVGNAADENQVKQAEEKVKSKSESEAADLNYVLESAQGRRTLWKILSHCGVFRSIFNTNGLQQSHNSGKQDVGHYIQGLIVETNKKAYLKMIDEAEENNK